jgi:hypothetical protein
MMRHSYGLFALAMLVAATPAFARQNVSIEVIVGTALVKTNLGLVPADSATVLKPGDRVFLKPGSAALLSNLENGCFISIRNPGAYVVPDMSECTSGQASVLPSQFAIIPANGMYGGAPPAAGYAAVPEADFTPIAVAGGFVAIAAGAALYSTVIANDENVVPVSAP